MKLFDAISAVLAVTVAGDVDPRIKLKRIVNKFGVVAEGTMIRVRSDYPRLEIKKQRVQNMSKKMLKHYDRVQGKCTFGEFDDDEQEIRSDDACFAFKKICKRILNWSGTYNVDCDGTAVGLQDRTYEKLMRITKPILRILECDPDLTKNPKVSAD